MPTSLPQHACASAPTVRTNHAARRRRRRRRRPGSGHPVFRQQADLFAAATEFTLDLPDLSKVDPDQVAEALLPRFFAVWEHDTTFLALLRAAMTSPTAADTMRMVFARQVAPTLAAITPDHPAQRAGLMGAFIIGFGHDPLRAQQPGGRRPRPRPADRLGRAP